MKRIERNSVMRHLSSVVLLAAAMVAGPALAQQGSLGKAIEGTWILQSIQNEADGKRMDVFGANPKGQMVLTPGGRFSIIITKASLPAFASNNRAKGTPEENQAVVQGSVAYFGTYSVLSEKDKTVSMRIEACTFPNWAGQEQKRVMSVSGDEMSLTNPTAAVGGSNFLVWKRVK